MYFIILLIRPSKCSLDRIIKLGRFTTVLEIYPVFSVVHLSIVLKFSLGHQLVPSASRPFEWSPWSPYIRARSLCNLELYVRDTVFQASIYRSIHIAMHF